MAAATGSADIFSVKIWETPEWTDLHAHYESAMKETHLRDLMQDEDRCAALALETKGLFMDYSRQRVGVESMTRLFKVARAAKLEEKIAAMAAGEHINVTEDRAVMHMALRAAPEQTFVVDGSNVVPDVHEVLSRIDAFSRTVRQGSWKGATGKALTHVVSIGIGGSYLGPEFVHEALRCESSAAAAAAGRSLRFLANVDPVDVARALEGLDPATTLVVVVSKTFTTAETMLNARTLRSWLVSSLASADVSEAEVVSKHVVAVSAAVD
ncbi:unnamed protein product, partial [Symbiodinium sp. KB8]